MYNYIYIYTHTVSCKHILISYMNEYVYMYIYICVYICMYICICNLWSPYSASIPVDGSAQSVQHNATYFLELASSWRPVSESCLPSAFIPRGENFRLLEADNIKLSSCTSYLSCFDKPPLVKSLLYPFSALLSAEGCQESSKRSVKGPIKQPLRDIPDRDPDGRCGKEENLLTVLDLFRQLTSFQQYSEHLR